MVSRTVLIVWERGGNLGHLARLLPVAHRLRTLGCRVVFAVAREDDGIRRMAPEGFEWILAPGVAGQTQETTSVLCHAELYLRAAFAHPEQASRCVQQWWRVFEALRPDVLLVDASPLALYAAQCLGLPAWVLGHGFEIPPPGSMPCFKPWEEGVVQRMADLEQRLGASLQQLGQMLPGDVANRAAASLPALFAPASSILCAWPELDHFDRSGTSADLAPRYAGPIWSEPAHAQVMDWPARPGPKVLCYLNLKDKRHDLLWQALIREGANVLVLSPIGTARACEAVRGWGITVVETPVRMSALLAACAAVITHGGMGTVSMALHAGKPLLLLPENVEQGILAYRLSRQGLAAATVRLREKTRVREWVCRLLGDTSLRTCAGSLARKYSNFTPELAVSRVVSLLYPEIEALSHP